MDALPDSRKSVSVAGGIQLPSAAQKKVAAIR
jgi:hypothetical protein